MGKLSRSVRMKTMPVEGGAGRMRIETGTPLCRPIPRASAGRCRVVSNRTDASSGPACESHGITLGLQTERSILAVTNTSRYAFDLKSFVKFRMWLNRNTLPWKSWRNQVDSGLELVVNLSRRQCLGLAAAGLVRAG